MLCVCGCDLWARQTSEKSCCEEACESPNDRLEANRLERLILLKFLPTFVVVTFLFFPFLFYFAKKRICKASLYIEKHLLFSTLVEKKYKKKTPNNQTCQFSQARAYCTAYSVFVRRFFFLTSLIVSAFLVKHSVRQQNLSFQTPTPGAAELFLTRGLFSRLYLLFITCWRSCWDSAFGDDTTASETWRPHRALQVPPPRSGGKGGNLQFFFFMGEYFEFDHMQWL